MAITGGCLCGAVRYTITAEPIMARTCWCRLCQYIGAGSATVNAFFPRESLTCEGELVDFQSTADSGNIMHRRFCPICGTHVIVESEARKLVIGVRAGTLDDPEIAGPASTIWTSMAPSWACIDDDLPRTERQPPPVA